MSRKNNLHLILFIFIMGISSALKANAQKEVVDTIELGDKKNAYLKIRGTKVLSLDMGGDDNVIFEPDNGVIKMKAVKAGFMETNFTIICKDSLLMFIVKYSKNPKKFIYDYDFNDIRLSNLKNRYPELAKVEQKPTLAQSNGQQKEVILDVITKGINNAQVSAIKDVVFKKVENKPLKKPEQETIIKEKPKPVKTTSDFEAGNFTEFKNKSANISLGEVKDGIKLRLQKLYVDDKFIYFGITISNTTTMDYIVDYVNFEVRPKNAALSAIANQSVYPEYQSSSDNSPEVTPGSINTLLYAIEKFSIRNDEILIFSMFESSTVSKGRSNTIKLTSSDFNKIKKIN